MSYTSIHSVGTRLKRCSQTMAAFLTAIYAIFQYCCYKKNPLFLNSEKCHVNSAKFHENYEGKNRLSCRLRTNLGDTSFEIYNYIRKRTNTCTAPHDNMQSWQCLCGGGLKLLKWNVQPCPPGV